MPTATLSSKGQIELVAATRSVKALKGMVRKPATPVTIEQMKTWKTQLENFTQRIKML